MGPMGLSLKVKKEIIAIMIIDKIIKFVMAFRKVPLFSIEKKKEMSLKNFGS